MPPSESIELVGAKELEKILNGLEAKVARKLGSKALRAGAKIIQKEAQAQAPSQTGALRKAIKVRAGKNKKGYRSVKVALADKWFTGDQFYAAFQEFGWKTGKRKNEAEATAKRIARVLRGQARKAREQGGGLAEKGTDFRGRQEAFFLQEGRRQSAKMGVKPRREIPGKHYMEKAFEAKSAEAVRKITDVLKELANKAVNA